MLSKRLSATEAGLRREAEFVTSELASTQESIRVEISRWHFGEIDAGGEVIFAVGDVHGCADLLHALLNAFGELNASAARPQRLVFLGDLINRGPETVQALQLWAEEAPIPGITRVDRLMGNHEQLLLLATQRDASSKMACEMMLQCGGERFLQELRKAAGTPDAELGGELLRNALSDKILDGIQSNLKASVVVGNLIFVHAGVDPGLDQNDFFSLPADMIPKDGRHWAWIDKAFLTWRGGFDGKIVVHGHTPPAKRYALTHQHDPHVLLQDRLCLDGGSAATGTVVGAQIENGQYRVFRVQRVRSNLRE